MTPSANGAKVGGMAHIRHTELVRLYAEPNGNNPAKHIGFVCKDCKRLLTARYQWSEPLKAAQKVAGAPLVRNLSHAARIRAAEDLGLLMVAS